MVYRGSFARSILEWILVECTVSYGRAGCQPALPQLPNISCKPYKQLKTALVFFLLSAVLSLVHPGIYAQSAPPPSFCNQYPPAPNSNQWQSSQVFYSSDRLTYVKDWEGNRIPDYSYAGYRYGEVPIPSVPEVMR